MASKYRPARVGRNWAEELSRREHGFLQCPHPLAPKIDLSQVTIEDVFEKDFFAHPVLVDGRLPIINMPASEPWTIDDFADAIGPTRPSLNEDGVRTGEFR